MTSRAPGSRRRSRARGRLEDVARGIEADRISFANLDLYFPEAAGLSSLTHDELAEALRRSPRFVVALSRALGLAQPLATRRMRADDAELISSLVESWHMASDDELQRIARLTETVGDE